MTPGTLRRAVAADAGPIADVWLRSRHAALPAVPASMHPDDDVRQWFATVVVPIEETWLAEVDGAAVAVLVLDGDDFAQFYVDPDWQRCGVGSQLVRLAQDLRPGGLALWTFQANFPARRFYERHGFVAVRWTDGSINEERTPDVRYVWGDHHEGSVAMPPRNPGSPTLPPALGLVQFVCQSERCPSVGGSIAAQRGKGEQRWPRRQMIRTEVRAGAAGVLTG